MRWEAPQLGAQLGIQHQFLPCVRGAEPGTGRGGGRFTRTSRSETNNGRHGHLENKTTLKVHHWLRQNTCYALGTGERKQFRQDLQEAPVFPGSPGRNVKAQMANLVEGSGQAMGIRACCRSCLPYNRATLEVGEEGRTVGSQIPRPAAVSWQSGQRLEH